MVDSRTNGDRRVTQVEVEVERRVDARRGRPSVCRTGETAHVHLVLPAATYDRLYAACGSRITIQELIRRMLVRELKNTKSETAAE